MHTLPYLGILVILDQYLFNDVAYDKSSTGVEITIKEQDFIMCLLLDLLR